jgi:hypothetical protein
MTKNSLLAFALLVVPCACADFEPQVGPVNHCTEVDGAPVYVVGVVPTPAPTASPTPGYDSGCSSYYEAGADGSYYEDADGSSYEDDDGPDGEGGGVKRDSGGHRD